jgi:phosphatidate cytidylyltransferase
MRAKRLEPNVILGTVAGALMPFVCYRPRWVPGDLLVTGLVMLVLALALRRPNRERLVESMAVTLFGLLYVGWLASHLVLLRELPWIAGVGYSSGWRFVLLAFFITWSCDTGAYTFGRIFGRTRPWSQISPRKSLEGSIGGLGTAILAAFIARAWFAPFLRVGDAALLGVGVGICGQVGDLVESLLKRDASHGDSSDIIPGHGGILDRFDSLYFAAPLVYYYLRMVVFRVP